MSPGPGAPYGVCILWLLAVGAGGPTGHHYADWQMSVQRRLGSGDTLLFSETLEARESGHSRGNDFLLEFKQELDSGDSAVPPGCQVCYRDAETSGLLTWSLVLESKPFSLLERGVGGGVGWRGACALGMVGGERTCVLGRGGGEAHAHWASGEGRRNAHACWAWSGGGAGTHAPGHRLNHRRVRACWASGPRGVGGP